MSRLSCFAQSPVSAVRLPHADGIQPALQQESQYQFSVDLDRGQYRLLPISPVTDGRYLGLAGIFWSRRASWSTGAAPIRRGWMLERDRRRRNRRSRESRDQTKT